MLVLSERTRIRHNTHCENTRVHKIFLAVLNSRIHTWRDAGDMPAYMTQIGWTSSMQYSWLFP